MKAKLILIGCTLLLMSNGVSAQEPNAPPSGQEQEAPTAKMTGQDMMGQMGKGMMGKGMMGGGMMDRGKMGHGMCMKVMFVLMDADGDGVLSLEEFQTAHAKIFKAIDANKDGKATPAEMGTFMSGGSPMPNQ